MVKASQVPGRVGNQLSELIERVACYCCQMPSLMQDTDTTGMLRSLAIGLAIWLAADLMYSRRRSTLEPEPPARMRFMSDYPYEMLLHGDSEHRG